MADSSFVRQELVERLDTMAMVLEQVAAESIDDGDLDLATDLWVASSRVLAAADELWRPAGNDVLRRAERQPTDDDAT